MTLKRVCGGIGMSGRKESRRETRADHRNRLVCSRTVMTNADLEQLVATSDEWIRERTGFVSAALRLQGQACRIWD